MRPFGPLALSLLLAGCAQKSAETGTESTDSAAPDSAAATAAPAGTLSTSAMMLEDEQLDGQKLVAFETALVQAQRQLERSFVKVAASTGNALCRARPFLAHAAH